MKKKNFFVIIVILVLLALPSCQGASAGYDDTIVNDGNYTVQTTEDKGGANYSYPALEELIASIEDPEKKELVQFLLSTPTRVEFSATNEAEEKNDVEDPVRQMFLESFDKTVALIELPLEELREKKAKAEEQAKLLEEQGAL